MPPTRTFEQLEEQTEHKAQRRHRKRKPKMRVHSRNVLKLAQIIGQKAKGK